MPLNSFYSLWFRKKQLITASMRLIHIPPNRLSSSFPKPFTSIPTPQRLPIIGTLYDVVKSGGVSQIHNYIDSRHRQLGTIFREKLGHVEAVWLANPVLYNQVFQNDGVYPKLMLPEPWLIFNKIYGYKRGLFFMQGEEWARYRKILSPLLLKISTLHQHLESLNICAERLIDTWKQNENNIIPHLERDLYCYFIQGLMCTIFGREIGLDQQIVQLHVPAMVQHLQSLFENSARLTLLPPSLAAKLNLNAWAMFEKSALGALEIAYQITVTCLRRIEQKGGQAEKDSIVASLQQQNMSNADIQRIVADLFLAAADTTSHTMNWILYLLAKHPNVQETIFGEINQRSTNDGCEQNWQQTASSATLKGAVKEALRLYPVAPFLTRILPHESVIGGFVIPAETLVMLSIYSSGRDENYFKNAHRFLPERWDRQSSINKENASVTDPFASLPFGHGRRACVGRRLAETQMFILLQKAISAFVFKTDDDAKMIMRLLGTIDKPLQLYLRARENT